MDAASHTDNDGDRQEPLLGAAAAAGDAQPKHHQAATAQPEPQVLRPGLHPQSELAARRREADGGVFASDVLEAGARRYCWHRERQRRDRRLYE